jgi:hypothetical protein
MLRLALLFLSFPLLALAAASKEPFPGVGRKWSYYQSPNFELYSCRNDTISRDILEQMELLRALFIDTFKMPVRLPQPVTIFCFGSEKDFEGYVAENRKGVKYEGFCLAMPDRTVITLSSDWTPSAASQVVFHEYVHVLFHMAEKSPPPWFNEGVAELYSTIDVQKKWVSFGKPIPERVMHLRQTRLLPLERLFAVSYEDSLWRDDEQVALFYSESWAFLHYLQFGENRIPTDKLGLFLKVAESPVSQEKPDQFRTFTRETLGEDYAGLEQSLDAYLRVGSFLGRRVARPAIPDKETYRVRPATADEMAVRLAELSLRFTGSAAADLVIRDRLMRAPDARLNELLGAKALQANDADAARERLLAAFEQGSTNVAVYRELGRLESNLVFNRFDLDYRLPAERAERFRQLLGKSLEAAPEQSAGYEMLAWVEATAQKPDVRNVNLVQKHFSTLNDKPRTLLALAMVRLRLGDSAGALAMLDQMDQLQPSEWIVYNAEITRARIENRPVDEAKLPRFSRTANQGVPLNPPRLNLPH